MAIGRPTALFSQSPHLPLLYHIISRATHHRVYVLAVCVCVRVLLCNDSFDNQVSALTWDPVRRYAIIGLENGHSIMYFVNPSFQEFTVVSELDCNASSSSSTLALFPHPSPRPLVVWYDRNGIEYVHLE